MPCEILAGAMHHEVYPQRVGVLKQRRRPAVVAYGEDSLRARPFGDCLQVLQPKHKAGRAFQINQSRVGAERLLKRFQRLARHEGGFHPIAREPVREQLACGRVGGVHTNHMVARLCEGEQHAGNRAHACREAEGAFGVFEHRNLALCQLQRRVGHARVVIGHRFRGFVAFAQAACVKERGLHNRWRDCAIGERLLFAQMLEQGLGAVRLHAPEDTP